MKNSTLTSLNLRQNNIGVVGEYIMISRIKFYTDKLLFFANRWRIISRCNEEKSHS